MRKKPKRKKPKHRFQKWCEGKIVCACGWESYTSYSSAIAELAKHAIDGGN